MQRRHLLLRNAVQVPAFARQVDVLHVPQLHTCVGYILIVTNVKSLHGSKDERGVITIVKKILELEEKK